MPRLTEFDHLRVVLVGARNPLNIGAAARAMSNFGFSRLRVVNPYGVGFREARSAVGASELLASAEECSSVGEAVADCVLVVGTTAARNRDLQHPLRGLEDGARRIRRQLKSGRVALLFGSEKHGLSTQSLSHCHWLMRIPAREAHSSMNLGQSVAICLYELMRAPKSAKPTDKMETAASGEIEQITRLLLESLTASGYVKPGARDSSEEKLRRLVRRLRIPASDASLWLGMLRQILWKVGRPTGSE